MPTHPRAMAWHAAVLRPPHPHRSLGRCQIDDWGPGSSVHRVRDDLEVGLMVVGLMRTSIARSNFMNTDFSLGSPGLTFVWAIGCCPLRNVHIWIVLLCCCGHAPRCVENTNLRILTYAPPVDIDVLLQLSSNIAFGCWVTHVVTAFAFARSQYNL